MRDLEFQPGQRLAKALVRAETERDVMVGRPVRVEPVGVREGGRVPVGRLGGGDHAVAGRIGTPPVDTSAVAIRRPPRWVMVSSRNSSSTTAPAMTGSARGSAAGVG